MWARYHRDKARQELGRELDLLVVGGGITGAGVLREAARLGLRAGLLEKKDLAWGTSSWSSKMVHGGLRYLRQGDLGLTMDAVRERQNLLDQAPGLVSPLPFLLPLYSKNPASRAFLRLGLTLYDVLAGQWIHKKVERSFVLQQAPGLRETDLQGGYAFQDALTDDSRLVLTVLQEALADGALVLNYAPALELLWQNGRVRGVLAQDLLQGDQLQIRAMVVVNACGAWSENLAQKAGHRLGLRPLRGSHLVVPASSLPVKCAITSAHPWDKRPVFAFPFQAKTILGTTDLEHSQDLETPPRITQAEMEYLLHWAGDLFPGLQLGPKQIISTFAGIRPVVCNTRGTCPSKESRRHSVWSNQGLITVSGGKLTTFRLIAQDVLAAAQPYLGPFSLDRKSRILSPLAWQPRQDYGLHSKELQYVLHRYRLDASNFLEHCPRQELRPIFPGGPLWAELRWAARHEAVCRLEDLLLRRTRLGILCPAGGSKLLPHIKDICLQELGWQQQKWQQEKQDYLRLWQKFYSPLQSS
ncbi:MAG: glycerol-3-phosphate dehydrogenase/oxidase [Desulfohalobiaceae bacterium]